MSALEQDLDQARREADEARRAAGEAQRAAGEAQHADEQARQHLEQARQDADGARREADSARQEADQARRDADRGQAELDQARAEASSARQAHRDEADARHIAEERRVAAERDVQLAHAADRQQELACSDRMLAAFRRLDDARSLTDVLGILADQAETEIGRAALLLVIGSRLRGWEWRGVTGSDAAIDVPVDPDTVFGRAIATGLPASTSDAPLGSDGDPLAARLAMPPGRVGLAVPISVGGRAVAILYADDAGDRTPVVPSNWPELVEILARHAGRCLELLTISRASALVGPRAGGPRGVGAAGAGADVRAGRRAARGRVGAPLRAAADLGDQAVQRAGRRTGARRSAICSRGLDLKSNARGASTKRRSRPPSGSGSTASTKKWCARSPAATRAFWGDVRLIRQQDIPAPARRQVADSGRGPRGIGWGQWASVQPTAVRRRRPCSRRAHRDAAPPPARRDSATVARARRGGCGSGPEGRQPASRPPSACSPRGSTPRRCRSSPPRRWPTRRSPPTPPTTAVSVP